MTGANPSSLSSHHARYSSSNTSLRCRRPLNNTSQIHHHTAAADVIDDVTDDDDDDDDDDVSAGEDVFVYDDVTLHYDNSSNSSTGCGRTVKHS